MHIDHQADPALSILLKSVPFCLSCVKTYVRYEKTQISTKIVADPRQLGVT